MQYQPVGTRGVATYNRACRYGLDPAALDRGHELIAVVQIESGLAVNNVEDIAAVPGVDALFIGPRDLSHDLGVPGDLTNSVFVEAVARVEKAAQAAGVACGTLVANGQAAAAKRKSGQRFIAIGSDTTLLASVVVTNLQQANQD
jgi:2-dehydro-3-deoxyglucarate aldolase/4-hydroxy-2-oxoheptanedioate aldolase